jgi:tRNA/tmRNA/rRNA uracil-C5-methylase (TrmA/RlmC/RlmD family)
VPGPVPGPLTGPLLGQLVELEIGAPGHGGFCVARHDGRVVFVRHTLPGERVRALVTEDGGGSFCRADAVEILEASPDRVVPPCPYAGPRRCGGCDWQHAAPVAQRALKADVVREQFRRVAGLDVSTLLPEVEELPGGSLGWRTRISYAVDRDGKVGLRRHRSNEIEFVDRCLLGTTGVGDAEELNELWPGLNGLEVVHSSAVSDGATTVIGHRAGPPRKGRGRRAPDRLQVLAGSQTLRHEVNGRLLESAATGFWQVHPQALAAFTAALLDGLRPAAGESILELYSGAGALSVSLAEAIGPTGRLVGIEADPGAVASAEQNLAAYPLAEFRRASVTAALIGTAPGVPFDLVVLDPPRTGAGADVMRALLELAPRAIGYLACDPASLARDVGVALAAGWQLKSLRAFDAFPMTHHVECVAVLQPGD